MKVSSLRPAPDRQLVDIARYVVEKKINSDKAYDNARLCLLDALGCAMQAFANPECMKLVGPVVPGTIVPNGARGPTGDANDARRDGLSDRLECTDLGLL